MKAKLDETVSEIDKILAIFIMAIVKGCHPTLGSQFQAFALMKTALDILVSSLHMTRHRALLEMMSLLRIPLETGCTAFHILKKAGEK